MPPSNTEKAPGGLAVEATRSSLWSAGGQIVQVILGLATFAVLSRYLGPADYGLLGMAATVQGFLGVVGDSGMVAAVMRADRLDARTEATAFWVAIGGAAFLSVASAVAAPLLGWFYREKAVTPLALALAFTFLVAAPARVSTGKLLRRLNFKATTIINTVAGTGALTAAWLVARTGAGAWALVVQTVVTFGLQTSLVLLVSPVAISPRLYSRAAGKGLATFSSQMSGFSLAVVGARSADQILAGRMISPEAVGVLSMGIKLVLTPIQRLCGAVASVFVPTVLQIQSERQGGAFVTALRLTEVLTVPVALGVYAIAPEIVSLLPAQWASITVPLRIFVLGSLAEPVITLAIAGATARGHSAGLLRAGLTLVPVGWGAAAIGAATGQVNYLVTAWALVNGVSTVLMLRVVWREFGLNASMIWRSLAAPHLLGLMMVVAVRLVLRGTGLAGVRIGALVGGGVGTVTYCGLIWCCMREDAHRLLTLIGRASRVTRKREPSRE